jgi:hypothetical protein
MSLMETDSLIFARVAEELESGLLPYHGFVLRVHQAGARNPVWQQGRSLRDLPPSSRSVEC